MTSMKMARDSNARTNMLPLKLGSRAHCLARGMMKTQTMRLIKRGEQHIGYLPRKPFFSALRQTIYMNLEKERGI
jgi:hypothetical protein